MAKPKTIRFGKFLIKLATNEAPTVFTAPCGFTNKSLVLSKNLEEVNIPDCDDPDAPSWVGRDVSSLTASVTGEGVLAEEAAETWLNAFKSVEPVPVSIELLFSVGSIVWTGLMHLSSFTISGESGGRVTISVEMQSDGELLGVYSPT